MKIYRLDDIEFETRLRALINYKYFPAKDIQILRENAHKVPSLEITNDSWIIHISKDSEYFKNCVYHYTEQGLSDFFAAVLVRAKNYAYDSLEIVSIGGLIAAYENSAV